MNPHNSWNGEVEDFVIPAAFFNSRSKAPYLSNRRATDDVWQQNEQLHIQRLAPPHNGLLRSPSINLGVIGRSRVTGQRYPANNLSIINENAEIIAQYAGCYVGKQFPYVLLIDDDSLLPPNLPLVKSQMRRLYTFKSTGPNATHGPYCQQAQDLEYKLSGL